MTTCTDFVCGTYNVVATVAGHRVVWVPLVPEFIEIIGQPHEHREWAELEASRLRNKYLRLC